MNINMKKIIIKNDAYIDWVFFQQFIHTAGAERVAEYAFKVLMKFFAAVFELLIRA